MALADYTSLKAKQLSPTQSHDIVKITTTVGPTLGVSSHSTWRSTGNPGAGSIPAGSAVCDRTTVGGVGQRNPSAGELRAWVRRVQAGYTTPANTACAGIQICDRLVHMGGLDGTSVAAQTVSTSALTRSTAGAMAAVEIYTAVGATPQTFTVSYTNQAGAAGQVSQPVELGATGRSAANRMCPISLSVGDTAVKAVSTLTLSGSTGTVGSFGVTLYKPLSPIMPLFSQYSSSGDPVLDWGGYAALVDTDACLFFIVYSTGALTINTLMTLDMFED